MALVICSPFVLGLFLVARLFRRESMNMMASIAFVLAMALAVFAIQADIEFFRELMRKIFS